MTFLIFERLWHVSRHWTWSLKYKLINSYLDNKLNYLTYLILFWLGLRFIFKLPF
jgi:hypothetical protein